MIDRENRSILVTKPLWRAKNEGGWGMSVNGLRPTGQHQIAGNPRGSRCGMGTAPDSHGAAKGSGAAQSLPAVTYVDWPMLKLAFNARRMRRSRRSMMLRWRPMTSK